MPFYAHSSERGQFQLLKDHLDAVAKLCSRGAGAFGAEELGYLAGYLHDIGKYSVPFQRRIQGSSERVDHSTAGAQWIVDPANIQQLLGKSKAAVFVARLIAYVIAGHHGGLPNFGSIDEEGSLRSRLAKTIEKWSDAWNELDKPMQITIIPPMLLPPNVTPDNLAWKYAFFGRMLYSALVDADTLDTRVFCEGQIEHEFPSIPELADRFEAYMNSSLRSKPATELNRIRNEILAACERHAEFSPSMFSLTVPTGGGKTLSSMSFALRHASRHGMRRIIYVIPFTSIIEQNSERFREALGSDAVLEHHSNVIDKEESEDDPPQLSRKLKLSAENWDAPVIVTTSVQFFESLFSNKRSKCRKLHHLAQSVIIIDEAQSIPRNFLTPCLLAMKELVASYGCSVVMCTATQPVWEKLGVKPVEIMDKPTPAELVQSLRRTEVHIWGSLEEAVPDTAIATKITETEQILCIVNTRKHAKLLYDQVAAQCADSVYHLSGRMCAKHRKEMLQDINDRLKSKLPCRVISTQLIEAGVDVDFPIVLRSLAGIDSIAQAAGRCNREGRLQRGEVLVFQPEKHGMPSRGWMKETAVEAQYELAENGDPLSLSCIQNYFERIHGIRSNQAEQVTDSTNVMEIFKRIRQNVEIPYAELSNCVRFIEDVTKAIVIPLDHEAEALIRELAWTDYPLSVLRKLQPYIVQIYPHELAAFQRIGVIQEHSGVLCLNEKGYYSEQSGLKSAEDTPDIEVLIS